MSNRTKALVISAAAAVMGLLAPSAAEAQDEDIVGFTHAGSGCPAGSVGWVYDDVNHQLTVNFDKFSTVFPPGVSAACDLTFVVKVPEDLQISLNRVEYMGYADTEELVQGQLFRRYKYDTNKPLSLTEKLEPGYQGDYYVVDEFPGWSACKEQVTVATTARVDLKAPRRFKPAGTSEMVVDTLQYKTKLVYSFAFQPCPLP